MMKLILLILILTNCILGFTQTEFAPIGTEWYYSFREGAFTPATGYYLLKSSKDTIIESKNCKVLSHTLVNSKSIALVNGRSIVYHDTKENKIYRYLFGNFYLLYDFTKIAGDTIVIKEPYSASSYDNIISVVDSVGIETLVNNVQLKSLYVHNLEPLKYVFSGKIIERIGNLNFFLPINSLFCDSGCPNPLRCYRDGNLSLDLSQSPCDTVYTNTHLIKTTEVGVFPNPFNNSFTIKNGKHDERFLSIEILNQTGQLILRDVIPGNIDHQINLHKYPNGFYYLIIKNQDMIYSYKLIKI